MGETTNKEIALMNHNPNKQIVFDPDPATQAIFDRETRMDQIMGRRLESIRERAMLSIEDLAALTGLPEDCLVEHETAQIPIPLNRIRTIASALDTDAVTLLTRLLFPAS